MDSIVRPLFTGSTRDGGYATAVIVDVRLAFPLGTVGDGERIGLYGFGAVAHRVARLNPIDALGHK